MEKEATGGPAASRAKWCNHRNMNPTAAPKPSEQGMSQRTLNSTQMQPLSLGGCVTWASPLTSPNLNAPTVKRVFLLWKGCSGSDKSITILYWTNVFQTTKYHATDVIINQSCSLRRGESSSYERKPFRLVSGMSATRNSSAQSRAHDSRAEQATCKKYICFCTSQGGARQGRKKVFPWLLCLCAFMHHPSPEFVLKDAGVQKLLAQTLSKGRGGVGKF